MRGGRGSALENRVIMANKQYRERGMGEIVQMPVPIDIYWKDLRTRQVKGKLKKKSTVDFYGVSQGRFIAFDCKSTLERTRFPLSNIEQHQMDYLESVRNQGGIPFFLVEFSKFGQVFYLPYKEVAEWWRKAKEGGRKSIPYEWFRLHCDMVLPGRGTALDYLKCVFKNKGKGEKERETFAP